ncbi:MAG TPA: sulfotransferase family 2 domain-containing protein, partial [Terriglobales bacterium]|nr:sulfotransferase family 2 domain-containing protein [Terriglobales bacterium]
MSHPYAVKVILDTCRDLKPEGVSQRLRYSTFVSLSKRYMYFQVPKAACTRMKELLRTVENAPPLHLLVGDHRETRRDMFVHARENVPLPSLLDLTAEQQREVLESPDFLRITFVRNPYTRLASAWKNKIRLCEPDHQYVYLHIKGHLPEQHAKSLVTFEEFVEYIEKHCDLRTCDAHWRRQVDHLFLPALNFSYVGKIEEMAEGLRRFEKHLRLAQPFPDDLRNVSGTTGGVRYSRALADKVYCLYEKDFATLGYDRALSIPEEHTSQEEARKATVREETFADEVIERNVVISLLYQERDRLQSDMHKVWRLQFLVLANAVLRLRRASLRLLSHLKA